jgi:hypothetical protein
VFRSSYALRQVSKYHIVFATLSASKTSSNAMKLNALVQSLPLKSTPLPPRTILLDIVALLQSCGGRSCTAVSTTSLATYLPTTLRDQRKSHTLYIITLSHIAVYHVMSSPVTFNHDRYKTVPSIIHEMQTQRSFRPISHPHLPYKTSQCRASSTLSINAMFRYRPRQ